MTMLLSPRGKSPRRFGSFRSLMGNKTANTGIGGSVTRYPPKSPSASSKTSTRTSDTCSHTSTTSTGTLTPPKSPRRSSLLAAAEALEAPSGAATTGRGRRVSMLAEAKTMKAPSSAASTGTKSQSRSSSLLAAAEAMAAPSGAATTGRGRRVSVLAEAKATRSPSSAATTGTKLQSRSSSLLAAAEALAAPSGAATTGRGRRASLLPETKAMKAPSRAATTGPGRGQSPRRPVFNLFGGGQTGSGAKIADKNRNEQPAHTSDKQRAKTPNGKIAKTPIRVGIDGVSTTQLTSPPSTPLTQKVKSKAAQQDVAGSKATPGKDKAEKKKAVSLKDHLKSVGSEKKNDTTGDLDCTESYMFHLADSEEDCDSEDDSDGDDWSDSERKRGTPTKKHRTRPKIQRTWSTDGFSLASVGESTIQTSLYLEDTSNSDTDDEMDYDRLPSSGGGALNGAKDEAVVKGKKKKKKLSEAARSPRRTTKKQRRKEKVLQEARAAASTLALMIPEVDSEDSENADEHTLLPPFEGSFGYSGTTEGLISSTGYSHEAQSWDNIDPSSSYKVPAMETKRASFGEITAAELNGYNSDSALVRRRDESGLIDWMGLDDQNGLREICYLSDIEEANGAQGERTTRGRTNEKKKNKRRNSTGAMDDDEKKSRRRNRARVRRLRKRQRRLEKKAAEAAAEAEALEAARKRTVTGVTPLVVLSDNEDDDIYFADNGSTKSKKSDQSSGTAKRQLKMEKKDVTQRMRELDSCFQELDRKATIGRGRKTFDERFSEVEKFEAMLFEEREVLHKERESMAFERESLELQLNDEIQKSESLALQVKELEQQLHSQCFSNAGNDFRGQHELTTEKEELKEKFEKEKDDLTQRLLEQETEIQDLKRSLKDLKILENKEGYDLEMTDGKSRERLQGELLQTVAKLTEKEARLDRQGKELEEMRMELTALQEGSGVPQLKADIADLKKAKREMEQELNNERKESTNRAKEKDSTIAYLMGELARLKQEQTALTMSTIKTIMPFKQRLSNSNHITSTNLSPFCDDAAPG